MSLATQPAIHIRDNQDGTMTARQMFVNDGAPLVVRANHYLIAAQAYLASRWPALAFRKSGWSANAVEAVFHFDQVSA